MPKNVVKIVHSWAYRWSDHPEATPGAPGLIDLLDRIIDKGLVVDAADRVLLLTGSRTRVRVPGHGAA